MKNQKNKNILTGKKRGFSLVEVLISLLVLSVGMVSVAVLMTSSIKNSVNAKNQIIAAQLAQEGQEIIRNVRDNNVSSNRFDKLASDGTEVFINCRASYNRSFNVTNGTSCAGGANNNDDFYTLRQNNGYYNDNNGGGSETKFTRRVSLQMLDGNGDGTTTLALAERILVSVIVTWDGAYKNLAQCTIANKCVHIDSYLVK